MLCSFRNSKGLFYAHFLTKALMRTNWWKRGCHPYKINCIDNSLLVEPASNPTIVHIITALIGHCSVWANNVVRWICLFGSMEEVSLWQDHITIKGKYCCFFLKTVRFCERVKEITMLPTLRRSLPEIPDFKSKNIIYAINNVIQFLISYFSCKHGYSHCLSTLIMGWFDFGN